MKRRYVIGGALLTLIMLALCMGTSALYLELLVGFERHLATPLPADADVNSIMSGYEYAQAFVDEWQQGLHLTAVYANYREGSQGRLVTTGEITYLFAGIRQDWLGGIAESLRVHVLGATVVLDADTKLITYFRPSHSDRQLWGDMHPDEWGISEEELLQVAEEYGGREFRRVYPDVEIVLEADGRYWGDMWRETYYSNEDCLCLSILINLNSGDIFKTEGDSCDYLASSWRTVGSISR